MRRMGLYPFCSYTIRTIYICGWCRTLHNMPMPGLHIYSIPYCLGYFIIVSVACKYATLAVGIPMLLQKPTQSQHNSPLWLYAQYIYTNRRDRQKRWVAIMGKMGKERHLNGAAYMVLHIWRAVLMHSMFMQPKAINDKNFDAKHKTFSDTAIICAHRTTDMRSFL